MTIVLELEDKENEILELLADVWNRYSSLERLPREQVSMFIDAIYHAESLVITRAYLRKNKPGME